MNSLMHKTRNSFPEKKRIEICNILNKTLATTTDLKMQLKQAHWNIKGMEFIALHKLFDEIADQMEEQTDIIAERITSLGGTALGTLQEANKATELKPYPIDIFNTKKHLETLAHNFAITSELTRKNIELTEELDDMSTSDLYIDLTRMLEKNLWFIEAHLQS